MLDLLNLGGLHYHKHSSSDQSKSEKVKRKKMRVGLINKGKNNTYVDCEMSGPDAGMINTGENTQVIRSDIHTND